MLYCYMPDWIYMTEVSYEYPERNETRCPVWHIDGIYIDADHLIEQHFWTKKLREIAYETKEAIEKLDPCDNEDRWVKWDEVDKDCFTKERIIRHYRVRAIVYNKTM